jgi:hypothetical protein
MREATAREISQADLLLRYLRIRGSGSASHFRDAVDYCFASSEHYVAVARRLCALGHVECDWDGSQLRWRVVPASFYRVATRLGLCGVLSRDDEQEMCNRALAFDEERLEFGSGTIRRLYVADRDGTAARLLRSQPLGFPVAYEAYFDLLQRLAPLANLLARKLPVTLPVTALRFNPLTRKFDQEISNPTGDDGLLKDPGYGKSTYYYEGKQIDLTSGLWLVMRNDPEHFARLRPNELELPRFPDLPPLVERVLYFAGGRRETLGRRVIYRNVEHGITQRVAAKLGVRIMKESATR